MLRYILAVLVIILLVAGIYYAFSGNIPSLSKLSQKTLPVQNQSATQKTQNTAPSVATDTSNQALDSDLTALEKDLMELDKSDNNFAQEINSL